MDFCGEWTAFHDRMPGKDPTLRVNGTCCFTTSGWSAELRDHDGPQGINPRILMVDLVVTAPTEVVATVLTEEPARWEQVTAADYDQVHILVTGDAEGSKLIDVELVY